jgi:hypothetical protein
LSSFIALSNSASSSEYPAPLSLRLRRRPGKEKRSYWESATRTWDSAGKFGVVGKARLGVTKELATLTVGEDQSMEMTKIPHGEAMEIFLEIPDDFLESGRPQLQRGIKEARLCESKRVNRTGYRIREKGEEKFPTDSDSDPQATQTQTQTTLDSDLGKECFRQKNGWTRVKKSRPRPSSTSLLTRATAAQANQMSWRGHSTLGTPCGF